MNIQTLTNKQAQITAKTLPKVMRIEMISDIVCPWCVIGLHELELALARMTDLIQATIHFQPFQLMPHLPQEGEAMVDIYESKFGKTFNEMAEHRQRSISRAANLGFAINLNEKTYIYNTINGHRLLYWAELKGKQMPLQHALFKAHFTNGQNISDEGVLAKLASDVGLDAEEAKKVLSEGLYVDEVRAINQHWRDAGIKSVPAFAIDRQHLIPSSQTADEFEAKLRQII